MDEIDLLHIFLISWGTKLQKLILLFINVVVSEEKNNGNQILL